jgi:hypothetical protein
MRIPILLLTTASLLAGCNSLTDAEPEQTSMKFSYRFGSGAWQAFSAEGHQPAGASLDQPGEWVYLASIGPPYLRLAMRGFQRTGREWHSLMLYVERQDNYVIGNGRAGTCPDPEGRPCVHSAFYRTYADGTRHEQCSINTGTLTVTHRSELRVSGRFSGSGTCRDYDAVRPIEIRDGVLEVRLPPPP